jgi:transposase-like protein
MSLTEKQSFYLSLIEQARTAGKSLKQVATENGVSPATLYNAAHTLRRKGFADGHNAREGFVRLPLAAAADERIEVETRLPNGQPVWLRVPASQLSAVLGVLAS